MLMLSELLDFFAKNALFFGRLGFAKMLIHDLEVIFLHVPKTAGQSVE